MCAALGEAGLGQVLDIVPNHMAIVGGEPLVVGRAGERPGRPATPAYFDVDWDPPEAKLPQQVLLPVLGDHYGRVLEAGELRWPATAARSPCTTSTTCSRCRPARSTICWPRAPRRCRTTELEFLATFVRPPAPVVPTDRGQRPGAPPGQGGAALQPGPPAARGAGGGRRRRRRGGRASTPTPTRLDALLERQNYRLAFWRTAGQELDYRRFFDIHTLAALRVEDEAVFHDTHELVLGWLDRGRARRSAHRPPRRPARPRGYLRRLDRRPGPRPGSWWRRSSNRGEQLPQTWPVAGTTGYDFPNRVRGLFVDPAGEAPLSDAYTALHRRSIDYDEVVDEKPSTRDVPGALVRRSTGSPAWPSRSASATAATVTTPATSCTRPCGS